jgi:hypothetical protein
VKEYEAQTIVPNYNKSCSEVFVDATASLMKASNSLELLLIIAQHDQEQRLTDLPTWAVDFTFGDRFAKIGADQNMPFAHPSKSQWKTGLPLDDCLEFDVPRGILSLKAVRLDKISETIKLPRRTSRYPEQSFHAEVAQIQQMLENLTTIDPYKACFQQREASIEMLEASSWDESKSLTNRDWSTLANDHSCGRFPRANTTEDILSACFSIQSHHFQRVSEASYEACRCKARQNVSSWMSYCQFFSGGSILFATFQGFIGITPSSVKVDDVVLLPFASPTPIIIRNSGPGSTFEGLAFVHGVMEGELREIVSALPEAAEEIQIL